jgi:PTH1 family peptidyl-tRNA hydrolase
VAQVVVGLGNPGPEYEGTRHNVGHRVVDLLGRRLRARWRRQGRALLAHGAWRDESVDLVKPLAFMNESGAAVVAALRHLAASPDDLILVYDDIDLPLGAVRTRLRGSHGGHNGVRSVLDSLRTLEVRRVKVGIGRPATKHGVVDHVLTGFERDELPLVESAVAEAADRVLALIDTPRTHGGHVG